MPNVKTEPGGVDGGTSVTESRRIDTTSPLTGGGDLSADRTIAFDGTVGDAVLAANQAFTGQNIFSRSIIASGGIQTLQTLSVEGALVKTNGTDGDTLFLGGGARYQFFGGQQAVIGLTGYSTLIVGSGQHQGAFLFAPRWPGEILSVTMPMHQGSASGTSRYVTSGELSTGGVGTGDFIKAQANYVTGSPIVFGPSTSVVISGTLNVFGDTVISGTNIQFSITPNKWAFTGSGVITGRVLFAQRWPGETVVFQIPTLFALGSTVTIRDAAQISGALRTYGSPQDTLIVGDPSLSTHFHYLGGNDEPNFVGAGVRYQLVGSGVLSGSLLVRPRTGADSARFILPVTLTQGLQASGVLRAYDQAFIGDLGGTYFDWRGATPSANGYNYIFAGSGNFYGGALAIGGLEGGTLFQVDAPAEFFRGTQVSGSLRTYGTPDDLIVVGDTAAGTPTTQLIFLAGRDNSDIGGAGLRYQLLGSGIVSGSVLFKQRTGQDSLTYNIPARLSRDVVASGENIQFSITPNKWAFTGSGFITGRVVFQERWPGEIATFSIPTVFATGNSVRVLGDIQVSGSTLHYAPIHHGVASGSMRYLTSGELIPNAGGDFIKGSANYVTGSPQIFGPTTNITISGALLTASGLSAYGTECIVMQTGDSLGPSKLSLRNRVGMAGALFEQLGTVDLIDFGFKTLSHQRLIRVESRAGSVFLAAPEFEFGDIGGSAEPNFVMADTSALFRRGPVYNTSVADRNRYVTSGELTPAVAGTGDFIKAQANYVTGSPIVFGPSTSVVISGTLNVLGDTVISGTSVQFSITPNKWAFVGSGVITGRVLFQERWQGDLATFSIPTLFATGNSVRVGGGLQVSGGMLAYTPIYAGVVADGARYVTSGELTVSTGTPGGAEGDVQFNSSSAFQGESALNWQETANILTVSGALNIYSSVTAKAGAAFGTGGTGGLQLGALPSGVAAAGTGVQTFTAVGGTTFSIYSAYNISLPARVQVYQHRGTIAFPTPTLKDDVLGSYDLWGYAGGDTALRRAGARIEAVATQNWWQSSTGTYLAFWVNASGGTAIEERARLSTSLFSTDTANNLLGGNVQLSGATHIAYGTLYSRSVAAGNRYITSGELSTIVVAGTGDFIKAQANYVTGSPIVFGPSTSVVISGTLNVLGDTVISGTSVQFSITPNKWAFVGSGVITGRVLFQERWPGDLATFSIPTLFATGNSVRVLGDIQVSGAELHYAPVHHGVASGATRYVTSGDLTPSTGGTVTSIAVGANLVSQPTTITTTGSIAVTPNPILESLVIRGATLLSGSTLHFAPLHAGVVSGATRYVTSGDLSAVAAGSGDFVKASANYVTGTPIVFGPATSVSVSGTFASRDTSISGTLRIYGLSQKDYVIIGDSSGSRCQLFGGDLPGFGGLNYILQGSGNIAGPVSFDPLLDSDSVRFSLPIYQPTVAAANRYLTSGEMNFGAVIGSDNLAAYTVSGGWGELYSISIPANTLGTNGSINLRAHGWFRNFNGLGLAKQMGLSVFYGNTLVFSGQVQQNSTDVERSWSLDMLMAGYGATNKQTARTVHSLGFATVSTTSGAATELNVLGGMAIQRYMAEDSTQARNLRIVAMHALGANGPTETYMSYAQVLLYPKR